MTNATMQGAGGDSAAAALNDKINAHFAGLAVRKDLVGRVKGNASVPTYVLEYLLGQYCATDDADAIEAGIGAVKDILQRHYVQRSEAGLTRSTIKERGRHKVIDKVGVALNDRADVYEAEFSNLGIKRVRVTRDTVRAHPKLLTGGVWCIAEVEYAFDEERGESPWSLATLKPIQLSRLDLEGYVEGRRRFSSAEWLDVLVQSIGFNPALLGRRGKLMQLARLIPFCERNYNLIELGPKGTGKSHVYSELSPHGILLSGGEVTAPKLFVNNATGKIGLVGYWDCVAFDEFAGAGKHVNQALVDIMKNYMANKSFSRGVEMLGAEASMVFVGNTRHTVPYMLKHTGLFADLPDKFHDTAFLDRLHFYLPGWEMDIIRAEMFCSDYGFVADYLAEALRALRSRDFSHRYRVAFALSADLSTRDQDAINKTFSGLMKLMFPDGGETREETEELLRFAIEGRKRVKDQLLRGDATYGKVSFAYTDLASGEARAVHALEERGMETAGAAGGEGGAAADGGQAAAGAGAPAAGNVQVRENETGVTFARLFGAHLRGARQITVTDPYLRHFHQLRNLMEFVELAAAVKAPDEETAMHVVTSEDELRGEQQRAMLDKIAAAASAAGIAFTWEFDKTGAIHARHIVCDNGWKICLDRGLDIFRRFEMNDAFVLENRLQQYRRCKMFEVIYLKI